jgi:hypothetical protein
MRLSPRHYLIDSHASFINLDSSAFEEGQTADIKKSNATSSRSAVWGGPLGNTPTPAAKFCRPAGAFYRRYEAKQIAQSGDIATVQASIH